VPWESVEKILPYCDLFICDLKHADTNMHKMGTGAGNERIIENLSRLAKTGKLCEVRTPIIPDFNDSESDVTAILDIVKGFGGNIKYTLLPFHNICASKYESQGRNFAAANIPEPTKDRMNNLNSLI
jgi:pyruvate formate lyase activating enzyme